jgi:hypothetical protein
MAILKPTLEAQIHETLEEVRGSMPSRAARLKALIQRLTEENKRLRTELAVAEARAEKAEKQLQDKR